MSTRSRRQLPPNELPFLNPDGTVQLDWYAYLRFHDQEHGGDRTDRVVRSPAGELTAGPSAIAGAAGTVPLTIDGITYNVVIE